MPAYHRNSDYDNLAWVYNRHWGDRFLPASLAALDKLALGRVPANAAILDLCCGTGQLAQKLTQRGYRVTGLDGSPEMLRYARQNAPEVKFIIDDARTFTLPAGFHLAVAMFDSLNHVLSLEELSAVFSHVHAALLPGGWFLFDLITEKGYRTNWEGFDGIVEDDHVVITRNSFNPDERIGKFEATIFRLAAQWQRSDVLLPERCYSESEVRSALEVSGFENIISYEFDGESAFTPLTPDAERAFFLCHKA